MWLYPIWGSQQPTDFVAPLVTEAPTHETGTYSVVDTKRALRLPHQENPIYSEWRINQTSYDRNTRHHRTEHSHMSCRRVAEYLNHPLAAHTSSYTAKAPEVLAHIIYRFPFPTSWGLWSSCPEELVMASAEDARSVTFPLWCRCVCLCLFVRGRDVR